MMDICGTVADVAPQWLRVEVGAVLSPCLLMHLYGSALQAKLVPSQSCWDSVKAQLAV